MVLVPPQVESPVPPWRTARSVAKVSVPSAAVCAKRLVELAVVAKRAVVVAFPWTKRFPDVVAHP